MSVDVRAWLAESSLPEITRTIYGAGHLVAQVQELEDALAVLPTDDEVDEGRFGDVPAADTRESVRARIDELKDRLKASAVTFRLRAITDEQRRAANKALEPLRPKQGDEAAEERYEVEAGCLMVAAQCVSPPLTVEDVRLMRDTLGAAQVDVLVQACVYASNLVVADAPFLRGDSGRTRP